MSEEETVHEGDLDFFDEDTKVYPEGTLPVLIKASTNRHRTKTVQNNLVVSELLKHLGKTDDS